MINNLIFDDIDFGVIITRLLSKELITDVMIWQKEIWITDIKKGHYQYSFKKDKKEDIAEFNSLILKLPRQIAIRMGCSYNEGNPIIDGEVTYSDIGQLRFNAIHESLTDGIYPALAIRKTLYRLRLNATNIIDDEYADQRFIMLMEALIDCGCNVMIGGETGSGKTELLKYIAKWIRENEAIITMEDTLEVYLKRLYPKKNVLALKSNRNYGFAELLRSCLRQNPDWICVSETRGKEIIQLNEAVGTGHRLISTLHTDSARNIPYRMIEMAQTQSNAIDRVFRQIHHNINIGIHIYYYNDTQGSHRYINEVCEFYLDENNKPQCHIIYFYDYQEKKYQCTKIISPTIKMKLMQKHTNIDKLEGIFI